MLERFTVNEHEGCSERFMTTNNRVKRFLQINYTECAFKPDMKRHVIGTRDTFYLRQEPESAL
jgi:hypothetical protein